MCVMCDADLSNRIGLSRRIDPSCRMVGIGLRTRESLGLERDRCVWILEHGAHSWRFYALSPYPAEREAQHVHVDAEEPPQHGASVSNHRMMVGVAGLVLVSCRTHLVKRRGRACRRLQLAGPSEAQQGCSWQLLGWRCSSRGPGVS